MKVAPEMAAALAPLQHAVGLRAGGEIAITAVRAALASDDAAAVVSLDASNAFNEISRVAVRNRLVSLAPQLLVYFDFLYDSPSVLRLYDAGDIVAGIECGEGLLRHTRWPVPLGG